MHELDKMQKRLEGKCWACNMNLPNHALDCLEIPERIREQIENHTLRGMFLDGDTYYTCPNYEVIFYDDRCWVRLA